MHSHFKPRIDRFNHGLKLLALPSTDSGDPNMVAAISESEFPTPPFHYKYLRMTNVCHNKPLSTALYSIDGIHSAMEAYLEGEMAGQITRNSESEFHEPHRPRVYFQKLRASKLVPAA